MAYRINESVCNGCDACVTACPTQAISGVQHEVHSIDPDKCVSCNLCMNLCKNFAIRSGMQNEIIDHDEWPIPHIDPAACCGCSACVEVCPMFVLEITSPKFRGDTETIAALTDIDRCIGCEKCAKHCPVGAIEMVKRLVANEKEEQ